MIDQDDSMRGKPKIMVVSWGVFPNTGAISILTHNLGQYLGERCIIVGEESDAAPDWDTPNYTLVHIKTKVLGLNRGLRLHKFLSLRKNVKLLSQLIEDHKVDYVLSPFPDEYFLTLGRLSAKKSGVKFLPWFHNTYIENRTGILKLLARRLQHKAFEQAHLILSISEGLTDYYRSSYPDYRFETMLHPFNVDQDTIPIDDQKSTASISIAYTGGLNESCRESAVRCAKWITNDSRLKLHIFGNKNAKLFKGYGVDVSNAIIHGFLAEDEFRTRLADCDILFVPHGFSGSRSQIEYNTIFPTRTIQLLTIGRPILVNSPEGVSYTKWMQDSESAVVVTSDRKEDFIDAINRIADDKAGAAKVVSKAFALSKMYSTKSVVESLLSILENCDLKD